MILFYNSMINTAQINYVPTYFNEILTYYYKLLYNFIYLYIIVIKTKLYEDGNRGENSTVSVTAVQLPWREQILFLYVFANPCEQKRRTVAGRRKRRAAALGAFSQSPSVRNVTRG